MSNPEQSKHLETARMKVAGLELDLVNLRSEEYAESSRIPIMKFGTPEEDALRCFLFMNSAMAGEAHMLKSISTLCLCHVERPATLSSRLFARPTLTHVWRKTAALPTSMISMGKAPDESASLC